MHILGFNLDARFSIAMCIGAVFGSGHAAAGPVDYSVVDSGAIWLVHLDVDELKAHRDGPHLVAGMLETNQSLRELEADLGISFRTDLKAVTIYALAEDANDTVVIMTTNAALDGVGQSLTSKAAATYICDVNPRGVAVHRWKSGRTVAGRVREMYAATYPGRADGERLLVLSDCQRNLDRGLNGLGGRGHLLLSPGPGTLRSVLTGLCGDLRRTSTAVPKARVFQAMRHASIEVVRGQDETLELRAALRADDEARASTLRDDLKVLRRVLCGMESIHLPVADEGEPAVGQPGVGTLTNVTTRDISAVAPMPAPALAPGEVNVTSGAAKHAPAGKADKLWAGVAAQLLRRATFSVAGDQCIVATWIEGDSLRAIIDSAMLGRVANAARAPALITEGDSGAQVPGILAEGAEVGPK